MNTKTINLKEQFKSKSENLITYLHTSNFNWSYYQISKIGWILNKNINIKTIK